MPKPRKIHPRTFLPHERLLAGAERLCAFVNDAAAGWLGIPAPRIEKVRAALRLYLRVLTDEQPERLLRREKLLEGNQHLTLLDLRQRALRPLVGLLAEQPLSVRGQFFIDEHGQQHLTPEVFSSRKMELLAVAGDLLNPGANVRVRRCNCALYARECERFLVNNIGAPPPPPFKIPENPEERAAPTSRRRGAKPRCVPAHLLLAHERLALHRVSLKGRAALLAKFREDADARAEAASRPRRGK
jgi:hypothetical protein